MQIIKAKDVDYEPTKAIPEKEELLRKIREALIDKDKLCVINSKRQTMIASAIDEFFEDNMVQSKKKIW